MDEQLYTPSSAYDEAQERGPDHDAMQLAFFRDRTKGIGRKRYFEDAKFEYELVFIEAEYPIDGRSGIRAFADICEHWRSVGHVSLSLQKTVLYELKPRIYSSGALLRQLKVLSRLSSSSVFPVLCANDPKLNEFRQLWMASSMLWQPPDGFHWLNPPE